MAAIVRPQRVDLEDQPLVHRIKLAILPRRTLKVPGTENFQSLRWNPTLFEAEMPWRELRPEILPNRWILTDLLLRLPLRSRDFLAHSFHDPAYAMAQQPTPGVVAAHAWMQPLQELDWPTTLTGCVAIPAPGVHVERRGVLLRSEGALAPPVGVFGLLGVLLDLEGAEEVTPLGILAEGGEVEGREAGRGHELG